MIKKHVFLAALAFALAKAQAADKTCKVELLKDSVTVEWTSYKTTEKTPVKGSFKNVSVVGKLEAKDLTALANGLRVEVDRRSVQTGNPGRDATLVSAFFSKLAPAPIEGKISKFSTASKTFMLNLDFNGKKKEVPMTYEMNGDAIKATGQIDILDFSGSEALASLNKACLDLHKGKDGVSKTWSEVALQLSGKIKNDCK